VNTISLMLLGSIAHATGFAILGTLIYLALRRFGPAAGALASSSSIVIMAIVSLIVLGPWPRWWVLAPLGSARAGPAASSQINETDLASVDRANAGSGTLPIDGALREPGPPKARVPHARSELSLIRFLAELNRELRRPSSAGKGTLWSWPEWIAAGLIASLCLGLTRLGLGLLTIRRLRCRSTPITDSDLQEEVQILRAELSCARKVEPRETTLLSTPATIGWRRPIVLLPADWREWSEAERHAVLGHELAHVSRGDFQIGLAAQLSLALHFYHPLAHWLAARLRLEQELAADAWGAALSGGKTTYLATLAQMALRRDTQALTWPARAFLPSRGTFVRRIEMLKNTTRLPRASLPIAARMLTVSALAACGILIAGLRGPAAPPAATAQTAAQATSAGRTDAPPNESYNLAFLPADAKMVIAVRPRTVLERREARTVLESVKRSPAFQRVLIVPAEDVDQFVAFWEGTHQGPPLAVDPSGIVLRMSKPQDWKLILNKLLGAPRETRHDGQTYLVPEGPERWAVFPADDRTLVVAHEDLLRELIEDRKAPPARHPWDEAWNKVKKGQVIVALETRWLRRRIAQGVQGGPAAPGQVQPGELKLDTISPLLEKARSYVLGIDASEALTVDLVASSGSEGDAKPVASTLQALLTLGKNAVQGLRQDVNSRPAAGGEALEWIVAAADSLLDQARIETSGSFVHLQAKASVDLAEGIKLLGPAVAAAQVANNRTVSTNNMKQIVLAFHNYHDTRGHFPTPVVYGGASGKVPHSWRVAILPYIEQQDLYNRYNFDEPWDGPDNRKLLDQMPAIYSYPLPTGGPSSHTHTSYYVLTGEHTALGALLGAPSGKTAPAGPSVASITDGTSNTILVVEARRNVPWTKPEDIPFDPNGPLPELGGFAPDAFNVAFADGSVRYVKKSINPTVLKALITRDGGEVVSSDLEGPQPTPTQPPKP
jgi:prepilin-type processing-associated H-X9-DG protein